MAVIVNTNVPSLIAQRSLSNATSSVTTSLQRLSTGLKINSAADNAAGLFIAKGIEAQVRGSQQCQQNISIGINVLQTAEGDLTTIQDNLLRIKDLATQAASGTNSTDSRKAIQDEVQERVLELDRVAKNSSFNGMKLLDGTDNTLTNGLRLQVGAGSPASTNAVFVTEVFTKSTASGIGLIAGTYKMNGADTTSTFNSIASAFATATAAAQFIKDCEGALNTISKKRAAIGVTQNRLQMTAQSLTITIENLSASKSTLMDTDVAAETAEFTKAQILQQSSASLLMQANQAPQIALSLLG